MRVRGHGALELGEARAVVLICEDLVDARGPLVVALCLGVVVKPNPAGGKVADVASRLRGASVDARLLNVRVKARREEVEKAY